MDGFLSCIGYTSLQKTSENKKHEGVSTMTKHEMQSNASIQADDLRTPPSAARIPWWVSIVVILGTLLIVTGAVISKVAPTILTDGNSMTSAARVYTDYLFARNLPIAGMLLLLLAMKNRRMLAAFMVLTALIQSVDIINDLGDIRK